MNRTEPRSPTSLFGQPLIPTQGLPPERGPVWTNQLVNICLATIAITPDQGEIFQQRSKKVVREVHRILGDKKNVLPTKFCHSTGQMQPKEEQWKWGEFT